MTISDTSWIAGLLVVALFVSAVGTLSAVNRVSATGMGAVNVNASTNSQVIVTVTPDSIDAGAFDLGETKTIDGSPFLISNVGSVAVNLTAGRTLNIWTSGSAVTSDWQIACAVADGYVCPSLLFQDLEPVPVTHVVSNLGIGAVAHTANLVMKLHCPLTGEAAGSKVGTMSLTFDAA
jgi:hypothetical protein